MMKTKLPFPRRGVALTACAALVAACGGGGSDSGGDAGTLQAANFASVGDGAAQVVLDTASIVGTISDFEGALDVRNAAAVHPASIVGVTSRFLGTSEARAAVREAAQATQTQTTACATSGSVTVTVSIRDVEKVSSGDYAEVVSNECIEGGMRMHGSMRLTFNSVSNTAVTASYRFGGVTVQTVGKNDEMTVNGTATARVTEDNQGQLQMTLALDGLEVRQAGAVQRWDHQVTVNDIFGRPSMVLAGHVTVGGQRFVLNQTTAFRTSKTRVSGGPLKVTDGAGAYVLVSTEAADRFTYTYFGATGATPLAAPVAGLPYSKS